jgi:hypothetical protein
MMKPLVGASIFVHHGAAMTEREDRRDGYVVFANQPDLHVGTHAVNQVPEPGAWLREKLMTPSGDHEQAVEVVEKTRGAAFLVGELLTLGSPDAALEAILVQAAEELLDRRCQVESMKTEGLAGPQRTIRLHLPGNGPKLDVFPLVLPAFRSHPLCKLERIADLIYQWLSMV